ncbi:FAD:protein FMN transferase [Pleionea sediminis]|uniref:FAD:protein FMN transferase n=1 Tax=Pleionea sediminis TaxID=2569479 RepID=UPI00197B888D|nr:FAD:protein FMN transferase [Pleionea sediminis]
MQSVSEKLIPKDFGYAGRFFAMASPCECLVESTERKIANRVMHLVSHEAWRIEKKYSRYLSDSVTQKINQSNGAAVSVDEETQSLLNFSDQCFQMSDGLFDITSGVLRRIWTFKPDAAFPTSEQVKELLPLVDWKKVNFSGSTITLPKNMEIDLGGIGKEYAVDRAASILQKEFPELSVVINFGGDLRITSAPKSRKSWVIGVESYLPGVKRGIDLTVGAVCTSGDTERFIMHEGNRFSHILNPKTGYPVAGAPKTVTVIADNCTQAGLLATLASLQGSDAEAFLQKQGVKYFCQR